MDPNKVQDFLGRLQRGSKGAGIGAGVLAAVGGIAYGLYQSMYTGVFLSDIISWRCFV